MKHITFVAVCDVCGWRSEHSTCTKAQEAAKQHLNDNPHRNYDDLAMF